MMLCQLSCPYKLSWQVVYTVGTCSRGDTCCVFACCCRRLKELEGYPSFQERGTYSSPFVFPPGTDREFVRMPWKVAATQTVFTSRPGQAPSDVLSDYDIACFLPSKYVITSGGFAPLRPHTPSTITGQHNGLGIGVDGNVCGPNSNNVALKQLRGVLVSTAHVV